MSSRKTLLAAILLALASLTALVVWRIRSEPEANAIEPELSRAATTTHSNRSSEELAPTSSASEVERREAANDATIKPAVEANSASTFAWTGHFVRPDGAELFVGLAAVELAPDARDHLSRQVRNASTVQFDGLAAGRYVLTVHADGFEHRDQTIAIGERNSKAKGGGKKASRELDDDVVLLPERWISVLALTSDGRPFEAIATELGVEPKRMFAGAFEVRVFLEEPTDPEWPRDDASMLAKVHPPSGWQNWQANEIDVGEVELKHDAPLWIGFCVYGAPVGYESVAADTHVVVFHVDRSVFEQRFARVSLRVIDSANSSPVADARATLLADRSEHRRNEHQKLVVQSDGRLTIERIVPGRYELSIVRGDALHQERFDLSAGETRDLGDIGIGLGRAIDVLTLDVDGKPCSALLRVASYRPATDPERLFPPLRSRSTGADGKLHLVLPEGSAIVCAEAHDPTTGRALGASSEIELVEAGTPTTKPLVLALRAEIKVQFTWTTPGVASLELVDARGMRVASPKTYEPNSAQTRLLAGRYRARLVGANGESLGESEIDIDAESKLVEIH